MKTHTYFSVDPETGEAVARRMSAAQARHDAKDWSRTEQEAKEAARWAPKPSLIPEVGGDEEDKSNLYQKVSPDGNLHHVWSVDVSHSGSRRC